MKAIVRIMATYEIEVPENGDVDSEMISSLNSLRLINAEVVDVRATDQSHRNDQQAAEQIESIFEQPVPQIFERRNHE